MVALGLMTTALPFAIGQQPAGAAQTSVHGQTSLTFVKVGGQTVTCTVQADGFHNTDNPNRPTATLNSSTFGPANSGCLDVELDLIIDFKDKDGVMQRAESLHSQAGSLTITGAATEVTGHSTATWDDCDPSLSATCSATVTVSPK
jgi:hypothetical protein